MAEPTLRKRKSTKAEATVSKDEKDIKVGSHYVFHDAAIWPLYCLGRLTEEGGLSGRLSPVHF